MAPIETMIVGDRLGLAELGRIMINVAIYAPLFALTGAFVSIFFYYLFDDYDPRSSETEKRAWEKRSLLYQIADVVLELVCIPVFGLFITYFLVQLPFIVPIKSSVHRIVNQFTIGMFFVYAVMIFMTTLGDKFRYVMMHTVGPLLDHVMPDAGSVIDGTLHYSKGKKERNYVNLAGQQLYGV
jgi:hypothetical protein